MSFLSLSTIVFVVLKLTSVIAWSWLLVLSPLIVQFALWLAVLAAAVWASR